jgi:hypothetical protein
MCCYASLANGGARRAVQLLRAQVGSGPLTGLVHISEASDEYVTDLAPLFSPGQGARPGPARPRAGRALWGRASARAYCCKPRALAAADSVW